MLIHQREPCSVCVRDIVDGTLFRIADSDRHKDLYLAVDSANVSCRTGTHVRIVVNLSRNELCHMHYSVRVNVQTQSGPMVVYPAWTDDKT